MSEHRKYPRFKLNVPVEVNTEGSVAIHCSTSDLSLGGCYIESMYPFPKGTQLELKLEAGDTLLILARVVTCDPQFGNGIAFTQILPEDEQQLARFLDDSAKSQAAASGTD
jgi:hypothetical protein